MAAALVCAFSPREGPSHSARGVRVPSCLSGNLRPTTHPVHPEPKSSCELGLQGVQPLPTEPLVQQPG